MYISTSAGVTGSSDAPQTARKAIKLQTERRWVCMSYQNGKTLWKRTVPTKLRLRRNIQLSFLPVIASCHVQLYVQLLAILADVMHCRLS